MNNILEFSLDTWWKVPLWIVLGLVLVVFFYLSVRVFSYAFFRSCFQAFLAALKEGKNECEEKEGGEVVK